MKIEAPEGFTYFKVLTERGIIHTVLATDPDDAIEAFYRGIKSIIGHTLGICGCNGPERPLDRRKVIRPYEVQDMAGNVIKRLTAADLFRIERVEK